MAEHDDDPERGEKLEAHVAELQATVDMLFEILHAKGVLSDGHKRLLTRIRVRNRPRPTVRLGPGRDKYQEVNADVDCDALAHLCHRRCCTLPVELTRQDLEEGGLLWHLDRPYLLRRESDRYCTHIDRDGEMGRCTAYEHRPATCRGYDCREDPRVWLDFDARIPAAMDPGFVPLTRLYRD